MPDITVTGEQKERLERVRREVEAAFVDTYGRSRPEDALEYLLDTYTPPGEQEPARAYDHIASAEFPELQQIASEVDDVPGSGISTDEMRGRLLRELGPAEFADRLEGIDADDREQGETETDTDDAPGEGSDQTDESREENETESEHQIQQGGPLAVANQLLDQHDDKWRESTSGEEPYEVDLPDGTSTGARTRDDVRQLLFRHY